MSTLIQISENLLDTLRKKKLSVEESYDNIIWDLIEDGMELSEETKKELNL